MTGSPRRWSVLAGALLAALAAHAEAADPCRPGPAQMAIHITPDGFRLEGMPPQAFESNCTSPPAPAALPAQIEVGPEHLRVWRVRGRTTRIPALLDSGDDRPQFPPPQRAWPLWHDGPPPLFGQVWRLPTPAARSITLIAPVRTPLMTEQLAFAREALIERGHGPDHIELRVDENARLPLDHVGIETAPMQPTGLAFGPLAPGERQTGRARMATVRFDLWPMPMPQGQGWHLERTDGGALAAGPVLIHLPNAAAPTPGLIWALAEAPHGVLIPLDDRGLGFDAQCSASFDDHRIRQVDGWENGLLDARVEARRTLGCFAEDGLPTVVAQRLDSGWQALPHPGELAASAEARLVFGADHLSLTVSRDAARTFDLTRFGGVELLRRTSAAGEAPQAPDVPRLRALGEAFDAYEQAARTALAGWPADGEFQRGLEWRQSELEGRLADCAAGAPCTGRGRMKTQLRQIVKRLAAQRARLARIEQRLVKLAGHYDAVVGPRIAPTVRPTLQIESLAGGAAPDPDWQPALRQLRARRAALAACFEERAAASRTALGRLVLELTLDPQGAVLGATRVDGSTVDDRAVEVCVIGLLTGSRLRTPPGRGLQRVRVTLSYTRRGR